MEYQYANDPITGLAKAKFSLEHEVLGPWLEVEIGNNSEKLKSVLVALDKVEHGSDTELVISGREYSATITREEVSIAANTSLNGTESPIPENLLDDVDGIDASFTSSCGSEDFRQMIMAWAQFIS